MKNGWDTKRLGDVCTLINGRTYKQSELLATGRYPVLRVGNFFTNRSWYYSNLELEDEKYCENGDLLYAWSASFGPRIWKGPKAIFHYHIWKVRIDEATIAKRFLLHWFDWDKERIAGDQGAGTTMLHVTKGAMEGRQILLPPISEQRRVVAILDEAFEGIAVAKANVEKNLRNATEVFEGQLQAAVMNRGPDWSEQPLGSISQFKNGLNYGKSSKGQTVPLVGVADFKDNYMVPLNQLQCATLDGDLDDNYEIRPNDILTVRSNGSKHLVGRCMLVGDVQEAVSYSGFIIRIRFDTDLIAPRFLLHFMKCRTTRGILTAGGGGANINNINQEKLSSLLVPLPPYRTQLTLAASLDSACDDAQCLATLYERKLAALDELKASLLHQAFTGQL